MNDFKANKDFGARATLVNKADVPKNGVQTANRLIQWLEDKFSPSSSRPLQTKLIYARIDEMIRSDGSFTIMEEVLIEPYLWLAKESSEPKEAMERFVIIICR